MALSIRIFSIPCPRGISVQEHLGKLVLVRVVLHICSLQRIKALSAVSGHYLS